MVFHLDSKNIWRSANDDLGDNPVSLYRILRRILFNYIVLINFIV